MRGQLADQGGGKAPEDFSVNAAMTCSRRSVVRDSSHLRGKGEQGTTDGSELAVLRANRRCDAEPGGDILDAHESAVGGLRMLRDDRDEAFGLLWMALTLPHFNSADVERIRTRVIPDLRRDTTDQPQHPACAYTSPHACGRTASRCCAPALGRQHRGDVAHRQFSHRIQPAFLHTPFGPIDVLAICVARGEGPGLNGPAGVLVVSVKPSSPWQFLIRSSQTASQAGNRPRVAHKSR